MKQRILAMLLTGALAAGLTACGGDAPEPSGNGGGETAGVTKEELKVGFVHIGDESDMGYTYNMVQGVKEMQANLGLSDDQIITKYNIPENDACADALNDLIDRECDIIFATSFGFGDYVTMAARENPDIQFCHATGTQAHTEELPNLHNCFANIYEGRYLAGVAGGMKLQQMIDEGTITAEEAVIGYVAAFPFAEVVSGYTAFYQGAKSVCPSVTMKVKYVNSWSDAPQEAAAASALADEGCVLISQHSDNTTPATSAQDAGVFHCGYNNDMTGVAPEASLISCRVDWTPYFVYAISAVANGESFDQDWTAGYADGSVKLTELNTAIAAPGTEEALEKAEADLAGGLHVFAGPLSGHPAQNPDGEVWSIGEGEFFPESDLSQEGGLSAPQFCYVIDGITEE